MPQIVLLDFGASRDYPRPFVDDYLRVILSAANRNNAGIVEFSHRLGFLTGYESKVGLLGAFWSPSICNYAEGQD